MSHSVIKLCYLDCQKKKSHERDELKQQRFILSKPSSREASTRVPSGPSLPWKLPPRPASCHSQPPSAFLACGRRTPVCLKLPCWHPTFLPAHLHCLCDLVSFIIGTIAGVKMCLTRAYFIFAWPFPRRLHSKCRHFQKILADMNLGVGEHASTECNGWKIFSPIVCARIPVVPHSHHH